MTNKMKAPKCNHTNWEGTTYCWTCSTDLRHKTDADSVQVDGMVIRKILEREIASKQKSVDRLLLTEALDAAAREDAVREGLSWALFVLTQECGV